METENVFKIFVDRPIGCQDDKSPLKRNLNTPEHVFSLERVLESDLFPTASKSDFEIKTEYLGIRVGRSVVRKNIFIATE